MSLFAINVGGQKLDEIIFLLKELLLTEKKIMSHLDELTASVASQTSVVTSVVELLTKLSLALVDAGTDAVALKALNDNLVANTKVLADAVVANTPAVPVTP